MSFADGPNKPPVGGIISGDNWVAVDDDLERYVQIGPGDRTCKGHHLHYGHLQPWGKDGSKKGHWLNNQIFCFTVSAAPTPNPTPVPTAAPTPKATLPVEDAAGDGCKNSVKFSSSSISAIGEACKACPLCEESSLSSIFNPSSQGICFDCAGIDKHCDAFEIVTSFEKEWAMKFISLVPSHAGSEYDLNSILIEGSNEDDVWHQLLAKKVEFMDRYENVDYAVVNDLDTKYKKYRALFLIKDDTLKMSIDHYAIISSYTKTCASNMFEDITGKYAKPYKTI